MLTVNFVVSKELGSRIFHDIFRRFADHDPLSLNVLVTTGPEPAADIHHYHRPQLEKALVPGSVVTVHHDLREIDPSLDFSNFHALYASAAAIICLNADQQRYLARAGLTRTTIIPHGYDPAVLRKRRRRYDPHRKLRLGIFSRRYARRVKGEAYLLELAQRLDPRRFEFALVGLGRSVEAEALTRLGFHVEARDYLPYHLFGDLYDGIDFLLSLSWYEGGPASIPEALAAGAPVIAHRVGMAGDMIADRLNGLFLSGDLGCDVALFEALAANAGALCESLFEGAAAASDVITWSEVIDQHVALYQRLIDAADDVPQRRNR